MSTPKTNALRILDALGIPYRTATYPVDEEDLSAQTAAAKLGFEADRVFKTLALTDDQGRLFLCCVPASAELSLKKAAAAAGAKSVALLPLKDLLPATGYVRGGCSPLGTKRKLDVYVDETAQVWDFISVSAGQRGLQVLLGPEDLIRAASLQPGAPSAGASFADLV